MLEVAKEQNFSSILHSRFGSYSEALTTFHTSSPFFLEGGVGVFCLPHIVASLTSTGPSFLFTYLPPGGPLQLRAWGHCSLQIQVPSADTVCLHLRHKNWLAQGLVQCTWLVIPTCLAWLT